MKCTVKHCDAQCTQCTLPAPSGRSDSPSAGWPRFKFSFAMQCNVTQRFQLLLAPADRQLEDRADSTWTRGRQQQAITRFKCSAVQPHCDAVPATSLRALTASRPGWLAVGPTKLGAEPCTAPEVAPGGGKPCPDPGHPLLHIWPHQLP